MALSMRFGGRRVPIRGYEFLLEDRKLARQVESAEAKAADYHEEILAAHAERDRLAKTLTRVRALADEWDANENWRVWGIGGRLRAILDADPEPDAPVPAKTWVMPSPDQVRKAPRRPTHDA